MIKQLIQLIHKFIISRKSREIPRKLYLKLAHLNNAYLNTLWVDFKALSHGNAITIEKSPTLQQLFGKTLRFTALRVMFSHITTASTTIYIKVCYFKKLYFKIVVVML